MPNDDTGVGCFVVFGCFVLPVLFVIGFTAWALWARGKVKREAQAAYAAYQESLANVRRDPTNAELRAAALERGRAYMYLARNKAGLFPVDELTIANDINAASAGAAHDRG